MNFWGGRPSYFKDVELAKIHGHLHGMEDRIMAGQAELDAKLDELQAAVTTELKQLADAIAATAPDLSPQVAKVQAAVDALVSDDPKAPPPTA